MSFGRRSKSEFEYFVDYSETQNCPCARRSCNGFMFKVLTQYQELGDVFEEWECFTCRKTKRIGLYRRGQEPQLKGKDNGKSGQFSRKGGRDQRKGQERSGQSRSSNGRNGNPRKISRSKGSAEQDS